MVTLVVPRHLPIFSVELGLSSQRLPLLLGQLSLRVTGQLDAGFDVALLGKHLLLQLFFLLDKLALNASELIGLGVVLPVIVDDCSCNLLALGPQASSLDLGLDGPVAAFAHLLCMSVCLLSLHSQDELTLLPLIVNSLLLHAVLKVLDLALDLAPPLLALELALGKRLLALDELSISALQGLLPSTELALALCGQLRDELVDVAA
jgi:hypothetical protein